MYAVFKINKYYDQRESSDWLSAYSLVKFVSKVPPVDNEFFTIKLEEVLLPSNIYPDKHISKMYVLYSGEEPMYAFMKVEV